MSKKFTEMARFRIANGIIKNKHMQNGAIANLIKAFETFSM